MSDEKFSELLNELGVKEDKQWVPEFRETYWSVLDSGYVDCSYWHCDDTDNHRLLMNNVFKTKEEAVAQRDFDIEKAKLIKEIEDSSDVIDWRDAEQEKHYLCYIHDEGIIEIDNNLVYERQGSIYTTNKEFLENLIKNEPERIKKYLFGIGEEK